jgi:hypothetical protein
MQQNLWFTTLSTRQDRFLVEAPDTRQLEQARLPGGMLDLYVRPRWQNLPGNVINEPEKPRGRGMWAYAFPNASKIGLKYVGEGWYHLKMQPGQKEYVDVELTGGPMPVRSETLHLSPRAGGLAGQPASGEAAAEISVRPGSSVTIVAHGLVRVHPERQPNGPDGFPERSKQGTPQLAAAYLLSKKSAFVGSDLVGALIGSFDNFQTAFPVGGASTFMVPETATRLWLAVNDRLGEYADNREKGFDLTILHEDVTRLPTRLGRPGNAANGLPAFLAPGANLPRLEIDVMLHHAANRALLPNGYVAYAIYASHDDDPPRPRQPICGSCGGGQGSAAALTMTLAGVGLVAFRRRRARRRGD